MIDFSHHSTPRGSRATCAASGKILVVGTTGHGDAEIESIRAASSAIPVVFAPNFSVGVNTLFWLTRKPPKSSDQASISKSSRCTTASRRTPRAARRSGWSKSSPRRASLRIPKMPVMAARGWSGERTATEIGVHAVRGGDVVGDHTVIFAGQGERLELTHKASSRETFAQGAIRAAKWAALQPPGLYDMQDVLGLRERFHES